MIGLISGNHRKLEPEEVPVIAAELDDAWKSAEIPMRQWVSVVRGEIERYRNGHDYRHFNMLIAALKATGLENPTLLDVGASSGFYSEILKIGGFPCRYTALDYSEAYERMAHELYPGIDFKLGDARSLPFPDESFDIVLSGCCLIHIYEYEEVIQETSRVASKYAVFNRTPVTATTTFSEKLAYGVRTLEVHVGEEELLGLFKKYRLDLISQAEVFTDPETQYGHRTYLLKKQ